MILSQDYLKQLKSQQLKNHLSKLTKIQVQYFGTESKEQVCRHFNTNKNFQIIVNLCYTIIRYVLYQAGQHEHLYLGGGQIKHDDARSQRSLGSRKNSTSKLSAAQRLQSRLHASVVSGEKDRNTGYSRNYDQLSNTQSWTNDRDSSQKKSVSVHVGHLKTPRQF